jgi:GTP-binding protein
MKFVDEVRIQVRSGKGGPGCVSFLREKFRPRGGPDGGDGGRGGDVVLVGDEGLGTLLDFRYQRHYRAENGVPGMGRQMYGRRGKDCRVRVPVGTVVTDAETDEVLGDLTAHGQELVVATGGAGGRGNMHFATSTQQAPRHAEPGGPWEERWLRLSLKLMADVGLVGFPNAGKSTLISRISAARPKVADYPFTTLTPKLGVVRSGDDRGFVVADIPGLIEGAAEGAGLGHRFLKHVERVAVIALVVAPSFEENRSPVSDHDVLVRELEAYAPELAHKPRVVVLAQMDLPEAAESVEPVRARAEAAGAAFFAVSSVRGDGLTDLVRGLSLRVEQFRRASAESAASVD